MAQEGLDDGVSALEEWYSMYMTMSEFDAHKALKALTLDPMDLEAFEEQTINAMREVTVVNEFCGICRAMLDNWPDFEVDKTPLDEMEARLPKGQERSKFAQSAFPQDSVEASRFWVHPYHGITANLPFQENIVRRRAAAKNGCRCCLLILSSIERENGLESYIKSHTRLQELGRPSQIQMAIDFMWTNLGPDNDKRSQEYTLQISLPGRRCVQPDSRSQVFFHSYPVSSKSTPSFSPRNKDVPLGQLAGRGLAKYWTEKCLQTHEHCNSNRPSQCPTRLLSIATDSTHLVSTKGWTSTPPYATLSHCWGTHKFETLRSDNIEQMHDCIPDHLLTKTFLDAIGVARAVGLGYIWIDSWCIIQDDHGDWEIEAARMSSVYGGSSLNIAASSARDGTEGCCLHPSDHSQGFQAEVCIGGRKQLHHFVLHDFYDRSVDKTPLASRAWVLQEKILSPRTLHCGDRGMFWECRTAMASEDFPDGLDNSGAGSLFSRKSRVFRPHRTESYSWTSLVIRYSQCELTYPGDKLVALSGIASLLKDRNRDQYFAGIFRKELEAGLCWRALNPQRKPPYRAPSWSWAAVDGLVVVNAYYHRLALDRDNLHISVRSISVENTGTDPCGPVARGSLVLDCGIILQGTVRRASRSVPGGELDPQGRLILMSLIYADLGHGDVLFPFRPDCAEDQDELLGQDVCYLPILEGPERHSHFDQYDEDDASRVGRSVFGLVIKLVDRSRQEYERIGHFEYQSCERCDQEEHRSTIPFFSSFSKITSMEISRGGRITLIYIFWQDHKLGTHFTWSIHKLA